ncbi:hypothetical protein FHT44_002329 [Mycolicibacterium sp. BK634]|nr:DNA-binding protein [Mycolicibacterium sp. BK634]MBB3749868.1 hypothetical protein [Mycolicibacterium sp. BK634]
MAQYLHTTKATLVPMRHLGAGPKFIKAGGRHCLYSWDDLLVWITKNTI